MKKDICFPFNRDRWENNNTCQKRKHKMCYTNRSLILEKIPESKIISPNDKIAPLPRNRNTFLLTIIFLLTITNSFNNVSFTGSFGHFEYSWHMFFQITYLSSIWFKFLILFVEHIIGLLLFYISS